MIINILLLLCCCCRSIVSSSSSSFGPLVERREADKQQLTQAKQSIHTHTHRAWDERRVQRYWQSECHHSVRSAVCSVKTVRIISVQRRQQTLLTLPLQQPCIQARRSFQECEREEGDDMEIAKYCTPELLVPNNCIGGIGVYVQSVQRPPPPHSYVT